MTSTTERRIETFQFPTLDELEKQILEPLSKTEGELDAVRLKFQSIAGKIDTRLWEARLTEPPTLEHLGTFAVFMDYLDMQIKALQDNARGLREMWRELDWLRIEGEVRRRLVPDVEGSACSARLARR